MDTLDFNFIDGLNVQNAKEVTRLIEDNVLLKQEIECLKLQLKDYKEKLCYHCVMDE